MVKYPLIDFYRFLAAFIVCVSHFYFSYHKTNFFEFLSIIGVELFFTLSGFVLSNQIYLVKKDFNKNFKIFLIRRWIRTIPPYIIALSIAAFLFGYGDSLNFLLFLSYTQNFISDNSNPNFFPVAWSLSVEEWFYVIILFVIFFSTKLNKYISIFRFEYLLLTIILILLFSKFYLNSQSINWGEDIRRSVIMRLDSLCWGILAYRIKDFIKSEYFYGFLLISIALLIFLFSQFNIIHSDTTVQFLFFLICPFSFAFILIYLSKIKIKSIFLRNFFKSLANISYSMYLFHIFFILISQKIFTNQLLSFVFYIMTLIIFTNTFYYLFEKKLLEKRPNYKK